MNFDSEIQITDEWDKARWDAFVSDFTKSDTEQAQNYLALAHYAAFPIILSTDLVYKIYLNFIKPTYDIDGEYPIWQASEFLFSPIIREIGYDLYEIYPNIREILNKNLSQKQVHPTLSESKRMAYFMADYIEICRNKIPTETIKTAQELNYKMELDPVAALKEVFKILSKPDKTNDLTQAKYLLTWGKQKIASNDNIGYHGAIEKVEEMLKKMEANQLENHDEIIAETLKNFGILEEETNAKGGYNIEVSYDVLSKLEIKTKPEKTVTREGLRIFVNHFNGKLSLVNELVSKVFGENSNDYYQVFDENEADYTLQIRDGKVYISEPFEVFRQLYSSLQFGQSNDYSELNKAFTFFSKWNQVKNLKSSEKLVDLTVLKKSFNSFSGSSKVGNSQLDISEPRKKYDVTNDEVTIQLEKKYSDDYENDIIIKITNICNHPLHLCIVDLSTNFTISIDNEIHPIKLLPNHNFEIDYQIKLDGTARIFNKPNYFSFLKIFVFENETKLAPFLEEINPLLYHGETQTLRDKLASVELPLKEFKPENFVVQDLKLKITNPMHNQIEKELLSQLLQNEKSRDVTLGNYYNIKKDRLRRPIYVLKPEIKLIDESPKYK